jgi:hypothetical protein
MAKQKKQDGNFVPVALKADKNFRLAKRTKTMLALMPFKSKEDRNSFKRAMIGAQLAAEAAARAPIGKREREDVSA